MFFLKICGSWRIVRSSVSGRNITNAAHFSATSWSYIILHVLDIGCWDCNLARSDSPAQGGLVLRPRYQSRYDRFCEEVLRESASETALTLCLLPISSTLVLDRSVQIASSNSLFSHHVEFDHGFDIADRTSSICVLCQFFALKPDILASAKSA